MSQLLSAFQSLFEGQAYHHRVSTHGDYLASFFFEDLYSLPDARRLRADIDADSVAVNRGNKITGQRARRGDGTLGRVVPNATVTRVADYIVGRGPLANLYLGLEVKIGATKLIAQIDRVINDLKKQSESFKRQNRDAIAVGIVGVNHAPAYTGYEGTRETEAKVPPQREAEQYCTRVRQAVGRTFDELVILPFSATNRPPFRFNWVSRAQTEREYWSSAVRVAATYEKRFG